MTDITKIIHSINNNSYIDEDDYTVTDAEDKKLTPPPEKNILKKEKTEEKNTVITIDSEKNEESVDSQEKSSQDGMFLIKKIGSKNFRTHVIKDFVRPRMERDIKECFVWREKWSKISNVFFSLAEFLCIIQTVMAFTSSSYDLKLLSFLAGMIGVLCISFNRFATFAKNASSEKTSQLNEILITIGIKDKVPDLMDNDYGGDDNKNK
jgi:hypothetical protein